MNSLLSLHFAVRRFCWLISLLLMTARVEAFSVVNVDFVLSSESPFQGATGVYSTAGGTYWNPVSTSSSSPVTLLQQDGAATPVQLYYSSGGTTQYFGSATAPYSSGFHNGGRNVVMEIVGLDPSRVYDVVLYFSLNGSAVTVESATGLQGKQLAGTPTRNTMPGTEGTDYLRWTGLSPFTLPNGHGVGLVAYTTAKPQTSLDTVVAAAQVREVGGSSTPPTPPASWHFAQLSSMPNAWGDGAFVPRRTGAAHSNAYLYFYKGTDNNIWGLFWNGGAWAQAPLTSDGNVDDWLTFGTAYNLLCYKGRDNKLWVLYFNGSVWVLGTLGSNANVAGDVVMDDTWNLIHYRATDSTVWTTWWNGSQWTQASLGGTAYVIGGLAVDSRHHLIYFNGSGGPAGLDHQMWAYYWNGTAWAQAQLGAVGNVSDDVAADSGGGMAYYRSSADNSAWAAYWNGSAWGQTQIDPLAGMSPTSPMVSYSSPRVAIYLNSTGQCCAEYWNGNRWASNPLGDGAPGMTGGLSMQRSGNLIFARRGDGHIVVYFYQ